MVSQQEIAEHLKRFGMRVTPQRLVIAEAVVNSTDHPSVQQIYDRVRQHFPSMTLTTIYSTLEVLENSGLIQELPFQGLARYEANMEPHVNLVCVQCGSIVDAGLGQDVVVRLKRHINNSSTFEVGSQRVDFYGRCPRCAAMKLRAASSAD